MYKNNFLIVYIRIYQPEQYVAQGQFFQWSFNRFESRVFLLVDRLPYQY